MIGLMLFLREAITHPSMMGALFPSSKTLAQRLVAATPKLSQGLVVELGAGTGAITAALIKHYTHSSIIIIERSARLNAHLQARFPQLTVIEGDACQLSQIVAKYLLPIRTIISSLPLHSLSKATVKAIGVEIDKSLAPDGVFIQYTYNLWGKPLSLCANLQLISSQFVWWNLPPARIDVFRQA